MSKYRAIFFDLDGTAVPNKPDGMPSARLLETVRHAREKIYLVAATGRPLRQALPIISELGLIEPCIVSGGTIIIEPATQKVLKITNLPSPAVHAIFDIVKGRPYGLHLRDERIGTDVAALHSSLAESLEIIYITQVPATDIENMNRALGLVPNIAFSVVPDWTGGDFFAFNVTHRNATKEHAVADVLERLNVPREAAIGIGDGNNDLHLFRSVGLKVAMGNASAELKAAADIIAPTIDEDGLADIIERYA